MVLPLCFIASLRAFDDGDPLSDLTTRQNFSSFPSVITSSSSSRQLSSFAFLMVSFTSLQASFHSSLFSLMFRLSLFLCLTLVFTSGENHGLVRFPVLVLPTTSEATSDNIDTNLLTRCLRLLRYFRPANFSSVLALKAFQSTPFVFHRATDPDYDWEMIRVTNSFSYSPRAFACEVRSAQRNVWVSGER